MRVEILGKERRRRWSDETKLEVVMSVGSLEIPPRFARFLIQCDLRDM